MWVELHGHGFVLVLQFDNNNNNKKFYNFRYLQLLKNKKLLLI